MIILGLSGLYHDSAAALIINGKIIAAAQEERFSRIKYDNKFPKHAIQFCLKNANVSLSQIDAVCFYDKPFIKFERIIESHIAIVPRGLLSFISSMPIWIKEKIFFKKLIKEKFRELGKIDWQKTKLLFSEHHLSHAASSYFVSNFSESAIIVLDGVGEWATTSIFHGVENNIEVKKEIHFPHSIGLLYSAFTYYLGFKVNSGEYKLMGLAPYGNIDSPETQLFIKKIKTDLVWIKSDGSYQLNMDYYKFVSGNRMCKEKKWERLFNLKKRFPDSKINQSHCNLAMAIQEVTKELIINLAREAKRITNSNSLCLAGGVALNCVVNGELERLEIFDNIFVQPASGDAGGALGAALVTDKIYFKLFSKITFSPYLGPEFSNEYIESTLKKLGANYEKSKDVTKLAAKEIYNQKVVGWFQGKSEFGPRALGNRSILGDPRSKTMQSKINLKIKFREDFRPFAPSVLKEYASSYFKIKKESPFMLFVYPLLDQLTGSRIIGDIDFQLKNKNCVYPSITHVDNSARVQTVDSNDNPSFYKLIHEFGNLSNCYMVVNTSFNVRGEPIVNSPFDAFRCFMETEMDVLVIGDYVLKKELQPKWTKRKKIELD
ncbi:MAG: hypothetical protein CMP61_02430 [Flavobacteriales bacterium]|nr:hypothetical protein [Flavobacteriales bacterium]